MICYWVWLNGLSAWSTTSKAFFNWPSYPRFKKEKNVLLGTIPIRFLPYTTMHLIDRILQKSKNWYYWRIPKIPNLYKWPTSSHIYNLLHVFYSTSPKVKNNLHWQIWNVSCRSPASHQNKKLKKVLFRKIKVFFEKLNFFEQCFADQNRFLKCKRNEGEIRGGFLSLFLLSFFSKQKLFVKKLLGWLPLKTQ